MYVPFVCKIAEHFYSKTIRKDTDTYKKLIEDSLDALKRNDQNDLSFVPDINSALKCALNGTRQNAIKMEEINSEMMQLFIAVSWSKYFIKKKESNNLLVL